MLKIIEFLHPLIISCMNNLYIMFSCIKIEKIQFIHNWVFWPLLDRPVLAPLGRRIACWVLDKRPSNSSTPVGGCNAAATLHASCFWSPLGLLSFFLCNRIRGGSIYPSIYLFCDNWEEALANFYFPSEFIFNQENSIRFSDLMEIPQKSFISVKSWVFWLINIVENSVCFWNFIV